MSEANGATTMAIFEFDEYALEKTAKVLLKINPHVPWETVEELVDRMKGDARQHLEDGGYLSIYGYCLYSHKDKRRVFVGAAVSPGLILETLEKTS
jgi:hypothetical protein